MGSRAEMVLPVARTGRLLIEELADETLVYDEDNHKAHCLNRAAASVWKRCDGITTFAEMERRLHEEMNLPLGDEAVLLALRQLEKAGLLAEPVGVAGEDTTVSRRQMLARVGLLAAACLPLVSTIVAPTPAQAGSLKGTGGNCGTSVECSSGICSGGICQ